LQLVDQGKLSKSDTLSKWYPDFPNADEITIDDLLRMRSGIPDYWAEETLKQYYDNPLESVTNEDIIEAAAAEADQFEPPDQETKYTDTNYNILGAILEKVSGNDIATQIDQSITGPLGLDNTFYPTNNELPGNLHGYGLNPQSGEFEDKTILNPAPADGAGAMISNLSDLGVWSRAVYNGDLLNPRDATSAPEDTTWGRGTQVFGVWRGDREVGQALGSWRYDLRVQHRHVVHAGGGRNHRDQRQPL
jgi:D-alanyl-D-alanine carboxypeptidase